MTTKAKTLRDIGIDVAVFAGDGSRLNAASEYVADPMHEDESIVDHAISLAKDAAAAEDDAASAEVSVLIAGEWRVLWSIRHDMTAKTTAIDLFDFTELGRATIDGTEYVVYWDGAYQHAVTADDFDREFPADKYTNDGDGYTEWCQDVLGSDDETAIAVGRAIGLSHVHSTDGGCSILDCEDED